MNYCYFYLLNKIGGGYLINDDFYLKDNFQKFEFNIYNEKFIYLFNDITQELVNYSNFNDFCKISPDLVCYNKYPFFFCPPGFFTFFAFFFFAILFIFQVPR